MKLFSFIYIASFFSAASAFAVPSAIFHAPYDQDFTAISIKNRVEGKHSAEILWENIATYLHPGVEGKAALIGTGAKKEVDYHIEYSNSDEHISPEKGSIVFWVRPEDWRGNDKQYHMFFRAHGKNAELSVYKIPQYSLLVFIIGPAQKVNGENIWTKVTTSVADWMPGQWHFVSCVWGNGMAKLYVDGMLRKEKPYMKKAGPFTRFGVGGLNPKGWATPMGYSLIDELMIYNVPLSNADVLNRYGSYRVSRIKTSDERKVQLQNIYSGWNRSKDTMDFYFSLRFVDPDGKFYKTALQIADASGKIIREKILAPQGTEFSESVPLKELPQGKYFLRLTILKKDASLNTTVVHPFAIPSRPEWWRNSHVGASPTTPKPWTKPEWNGKENRFSCWNREYVFGKSMLPEQIFTGKTPLLTRPVELALDGKKISGGELKLQEKTEERITLSGEKNEHNLAVSMKIYGEFDGFFWAELTLCPKTEKAVGKHLTLDFPFRKEQSVLFNSMSKQYANYVPGAAGKIKSFNMDLFHRVTRSIFIGNDEVGMEWFCEEMSDWNLRNKQKSLQVIPGDKENVLRLNLADIGLIPGKSSRFRFGFQALPVKPLPEKWRLVRSDRKGKLNFKPWFPWSEVHNIPDPDRKAKNYDQRLQNALKKNENVHWYFAGFSNSPYTDEWSFYGPLWSLTPPEIGTVGSLSNREWAFARNCPAAAGYIDWYAANLKRTVEKLNITNLYFDNQDAQCCDNALHGCGWKGCDGHIYRTFNLLAVRELNKRIWRMFKEIRPEGRIMRHMSMKNITANTAFADYLADGENYCTTVGQDESYKNIFDPEMFRAMYVTRPYGIPNYFIPQFQRSVQLHSPIKNRFRDAWSKKEHFRKHQDKFRHFIGYCIVHDSLIWPSFGVNCDDWFKIQDEFGINGNEKFVMYNNSESPFVSKGRLMISSYTLGGKIMIIIMNDENAPLSEIQFNPEKLRKLGVTLDGLKNAEDGTSAAVSGNKIRIQIPARDYRILMTGSK